MEATFRALIGNFNTMDFGILGEYKSQDDAQGCPYYYENLILLLHNLVKQNPEFMHIEENGNTLKSVLTKIIEERYLDWMTMQEWLDDTLDASGAYGGNGCYDMYYIARLYARKMYKKLM